MSYFLEVESLGEVDDEAEPLPRRFHSSEDLR